MAILDLFYLGLTFALLGLKAFALVDALRRPTASFPAVGRQTKILWVGILALATASSPFVATFGLVGIAGIVAAGVYLADVRPRIKELGSGGPYGRW